MNERNKEIGLEQELSDMGIDFKSTVPVALSYAKADTSKWMSSDLFTAKEEANRKSPYIFYRVSKLPNMKTIIRINRNGTSMIN